MIVFLLLVIITILLFGSSVVLRGIGMVLGFIALMFAVVVGISIAEQVPAWLWWTIGLVVGGGIAAIFALDARQQAKLRRDLADSRFHAGKQLHLFGRQYRGDVQGAGRSVFHDGRQPG
jgi:phosphotransferase system  glucose/maltose/N-acetylglucosamine-specific IIC component